MRVPPRVYVISAVAIALLNACREDLPPFEASDRPPVDESAVRLTFSPNDDRSPAWSADGDTLYYNAEGTDQLSGSPGVLLALPRHGGAARLVFENLQSPDSRSVPWLVAPATDPMASGLAFVEIVKLWDPHACSLDLTQLTCSPELEEATARRPPLQQIAVHSRRFAASGSLDEDSTIVLRLAGVELESAGAVNTSIVHNYPFQQLFAEELALSFRPSWAPDGERVALSDGLRVLVWRVGQESVDTVPGTEDGA